MWIIQLLFIIHMSPYYVQCCITSVFIDLIHHDDVIRWKQHFPRYWPLVRGINRSPVNYPHKGQWRGALIFSLICTWINGYVNNREARDLRRHRVHYDVTVMISTLLFKYIGSNTNTSNGSWCMGIKGEMSGTVCVTFTWDMYRWVVYSLCFFCCLFITVTWWYVWCFEWASGNQEEVQACLVTLWLFIISCYSLYKTTLGFLCSWFENDPHFHKYSMDFHV